MAQHPFYPLPRSLSYSLRHQDREKFQIIFWLGLQHFKHSFYLSFCPYITQFYLSWKIILTGFQTKISHKSTPVFKFPFSYFYVMKIRVLIKMVKTLLESSLRRPFLNMGQENLFKIAYIEILRALSEFLEPAKIVRENWSFLYIRKNGSDWT